MISKTLGTLALGLLCLHLTYIEAITDPCLGKPNGINADPNNCYHYFRCEDNVQIIVNCPEGQVFDKTRQNCTKSAEYPCSADPGNPTLMGSPCPSHQEGHIRPSVVTCLKYLLCLRGKYVPVDCPKGLIFSEKTYSCIPAIDKCATHKPPSGNYIPKDQKGTKSPYIGICSGRWREKVADPMRCSKYIFCGQNPGNLNDKKPYILMEKCPSGLLFHAGARSCRKPFVVHCGERWRDVAVYGPEPSRKGR